MGELLYFVGDMVPGAVLTAAAWGAIYPLRRRRLTRLGFTSSTAREILLLLFAAFCGGMAAATLTPPDFDLWHVIRYGYHGTFFSRSTVN
ncbi:MAG: hypothetical protein IIZ26_01285, partial [Oscillospiraceae bacterium]|nr:hypothetical protein [Oscillospiraceae bacterium]